MSYLDKIIKQSPWLIALANINEDIHLLRLKEFRYIHHENSFLTHHFEDGIYIVTGPRQIGKSTHLKMLIQQHINEKNKDNFLYFNCDLLDKKQDIVDLVEEYLKNFPSNTRRFILLDEITSVKDSFLAIKFLVDSGHFKNITYILTGSNTISIKKTGEYLPGRRGKGIDFIFNPLSFKQYINLVHPKLNVTYSLDISEKEYLALKQKAPLDKYLNDYLVSGGIPRVINEFLNKGAIDQDIFSMYRAWITSEIAKADKKEFIAKSILERVLFSLGSDISYNAFAQDSGIGSHNTVYDYLDFFINCNVLTQIFHFDIHQQKVNYRKNKKIYFNDPFIYSVIEAWLTGKPSQDYEYLSNPILKSRIIENLVLIQLKNFYQDIFYYKEIQEIDFVTKDLLLEIKYQNKIIKDDYAFLLKHENNRILVTKKDFKRADGLLWIPIEIFLLLSL
ncbi:MAG: ATP-binding protein [Proteobacteria bacterium]|nr:ATP-binding protein [Pseudomonadota bacterium]